MIISCQNIAVGGVVQVQDHALVLRSEGCGGQKCLLPRFIALHALGELFNLRLEHVLGQRVDVSVVIIKSVPRDLASLRDVADGDLVEGTLCQKLDEAAADGVFGAQSHGWVPPFLDSIKFIISDMGKTCK